jgi:predicted transcriptional regulator
MRKYRNKAQITKEILELCLTPVGKTSVVYKCNLNFLLATKHLNRLMDRKLIEVVMEGKNKRYVTTGHGQSVIDVLTNAVEVLEYVGI